MQQPNARSARYDGPWKKPQKPKVVSTTQAARNARIKADMLHKQALALKAKAVNYEKDAPRCENCKHFRKAGTMLVDSLPKQVPAKCKLHGFKAQPFGCCDTWAGTDGSELAA